MDDTNQIIQSKPEKKQPNWQLITMIVGIILLIILIIYFFYKYIQYNNKKFKKLEQDIHNLIEKNKQQLPLPQVVQQQPQLFMQQVPPSSPMKQPPIIIPPPPPAVVIVDSKVLDTELSEELKELNPTEPEPEGRVETVKQEPTV